jgi:hypothetical protein
MKWLHHAKPAAGRRSAIRPGGRSSSASPTVRGRSVNWRASSRSARPRPRSTSGDQGRGARRGQACWQAADLPARPGRPRGAARRPRAVLEQGTGGLQDGRRAANGGGQDEHRQQRRLCAARSWPKRRSSAPFGSSQRTSEGFKPPEHNLLEAEIAETVFEPHVGSYLYDRGVDGSKAPRAGPSTWSGTPR